LSKSTELITVLDVDTREEALAIVSACGACAWFKIGSQLFTRCGPAIVSEVLELGKQVMLDLKFHDIPNTVAHSAGAAAALNVGLFTLHASGGRKMIEAARKAVEGTETRILAVTILTSFTDAQLRDEVGFHETSAEAVPRLAKQAVESGAHGIVCSPQEIELVRAAVGPEPIVVTPGIRPAWSSKDDQKRIMTPALAITGGADHLVVGRPVTEAADPVAVAEAIVADITAARALIGKTNTKAR